MHPLNSIVRIMKVNQTLLMCFTNIFWKNQTIYNITAYFTSNIITLRSCNFRILVTVFLNYIFIYAINNRHDFAISRIAVSSKLALITITNIRFCDIIITALHQKWLNCILNIFDRYGAILYFKIIIYFCCDCLNCNLRHCFPAAFFYFVACFLNCKRYLPFLELVFTTITLNYIHATSLSKI